MRKKGRKKVKNRCRDCVSWEEYKIPCGNRVGKCTEMFSYFWSLSRTQYGYKCGVFTKK